MSRQKISDRKDINIERKHPTFYPTAMGISSSSEGEIIIVDFIDGDNQISYASVALSKKFAKNLHESLDEFIKNEPIK